MISIVLKMMRSNAVFNTAWPHMNVCILSSLNGWLPPITDHLPSANTYPKHQNFPSQSAIVRTSRQRPPLISDHDHFLCWPLYNIDSCKQPWQITPAKKRRDSCSGPPTDSTNYPKCVSNFPSTWLAKSTVAFSTVQSLRELESQFSGGGPEQGFRRCFEDGLSQRFFLWRSRLQRSCQRKSSDESRLPHYVRNLIRKYKTL